MSGPIRGAIPEVEEACDRLMFCRGKFIGARLNGAVWTPAELARRNALSMTDRMILDQLAARVDRLARQLNSSGENVS